ncbi:hypothetical protein BKA63DRAFT_562042 [Paraphoma chrysanthemicola]|nr:hypothetical protein BKA63DRAFT_562042 [Paraphoma chrysanthemicola]
MVLTRARSRLARAQETTKTFRILDLPAELVLQIFESLAKDNRSSILAARSACRTLRDHSFVAFGTNFFEHVVVVLHPISLIALLEIAKHKQLSKFVRRLTVSGERISGVINVRGQENEAALKEQQTSMENSRMDVLILTEVLRDLGNIETMQIGHQSYHFDREISMLLDMDA